MKQASYVDDRGRKWVTLLPDTVPDSEAEAGIPLGPIDLDPLGWPEATITRLHNELVARGLLTAGNLRRNRKGLATAIAAALKADAESVLALTRMEETNGPDFEQNPETAEQPRMAGREPRARSSRPLSRVRTRNLA